MTHPISDALYDAGIKLGGIGEPFVEMEAQFWKFLPGLVFLIVFILIGWLVGKLIAKGFRKFLEKVGFEKAMQKIKLEKHFKSIGFESVSHFISIFIFWFVFLIFFQIGLGAVKIEIISDILAPIILFIPRALIAALLIVIGLYVGTLISEMVIKALKKTGIQKKIGEIDKHLRQTGYGMLDIFGIIIKIWVLLFFVQAALDILSIAALTDILNPIILYFPRIVTAFFVVLIGLIVADYIVEMIRKWLKSTEMGKKIATADKSSETSGFSILKLVLIFVKVWILLIFVQLALDILAIPILTQFINPILLYFPRLIVAMGVIIIGLLVTEWVIKMVHGLLKEFEAHKFIKPLEDIIKKPGLVMKFLDFIIKVTIMLIFVDIAVAILGITIISELVNKVILWMPNVFAAMLIVLLGMWIAGWLSDKTLEMSKENKVPFPSMVSNAVKFLVIYIVITMALAQLGIQVPVLYLAFGIVLGAVMIGIGAGFAFGLKDVSKNMGGYLQVSELVKPGDNIEVGDYKGQVKEITRYNVIIRDEMGNQKAIPNNYLVENTVTTFSS
ncbi:MAG: mechanosensitive ion channel [Thermoplasmata archaeon]